MQSTVFLMQAGGQSGGPEQRKDIHNHSISLPLSGEPIIVALSMNTENKFPHGGPMKAIASSCLPLLFLFFLSSFLLLSFSSRKGKTKERQVDYGLFGTGQRSPHHQNLDILNLKNYEEQGMIEMVFWPCPTCRFIHPVGPGRTGHCSKGVCRMPELVNASCGLQC